MDVVSTLYVPAGFIRAFDNQSGLRTMVISNDSTLRSRLRNLSDSVMTTSRLLSSNSTLKPTSKEIESFSAAFIKLGQKSCTFLDSRYWDIVRSFDDDFVPRSAQYTGAESLPCLSSFIEYTDIFVRDSLRVMSRQSDHTRCWFTDLSVQLRFRGLLDRLVFLSQTTHAQSRRFRLLVHFIIFILNRKLSELFCGLGDYGMELYLSTGL